MQSTSPPTPSIEERLCAAAYTILTDGLPHSDRAQEWALQVLQDAAPPGDRTSFMRELTVPPMPRIVLIARAAELDRLRYRMQRGRALSPTTTTKEKAHVSTRTRAEGHVHQRASAHRASR